MKSLIRDTILLVLAIFVPFSDPALCGDNYTVSISCVIPEIPGVNSPVIQENTRINVYPKETQSQDGQKEIKKEAQQIIQSESEKALPSADARKNSTVLLQTFYSR